MKRMIYYPDYRIMLRFTLACAQAQVALEDIALWLRQFSFPDFAV